MRSGEAPGRRAAEIRERNAALDRDLRAVAAQISPEMLTRDPGDGEWTLAQVLAHLGEFPHFFAVDLGAWLDAGAERDTVPVGRTHEHPVRLAAVNDPPAELDKLRRTMDRALQELAATLERLEDGHVQAPMNNRKYGSEPLTSYLDRYILGHKAGHVEQLQSTLQQVSATHRS